MVAATLFENNPYVNLPFNLIGWVGWFVLAALVVWVVKKNFTLDFRDNYWWTFGILAFSSLVTAVIFVVKLPGLNTIALPNIPQEYTYPIIQVLIAIPWILSAGLLGVWPTVVFAFLSGVITALWGTHNVFTPLEFAILALLLGVSSASKLSFKTLHLAALPIRSRDWGCHIDNSTVPFEYFFQHKWRFGCQVGLRIYTVVDEYVDQCGCNSSSQVLCVKSSRWQNPKIG